MDSMEIIAMFGPPEQKALATASATRLGLQSCPEFDSWIQRITRISTTPASSQRALVSSVGTLKVPQDVRGTKFEVLSTSYAD